MKIDFSNLKFDDKGLIPAIVQDVYSDEVLMLAYMNGESLAKTVETGYTWFWSRSRQELWNKGATSGHMQKVESITYDCDGDALLVKVDQTGAACHTGHRSCFFNPLWNEGEGRNLPVPEPDNESAETIIASKNNSRQEVIYEMSDLWYHCMVLLAYHGITPAELLHELSGRRSKENNSKY